MEIEDSDASDSDDETMSVAAEKDVQEHKPSSAKTMIEGFCGCGRLAEEVMKAGVQAVAVDYRENKDKPDPSVEYVWIDVSTQHGLSEFKKLVTERDAGVVSLAPPCGTASMAREIKRGDGGPPPLRSKEYPDALPSLSGKNAERVAAANALYSNTVHLVK